MQPKVTADQARAIISYEPMTGELKWRARPLSMFPSEWSWKVWNKRFAETPALVSADSTGHLYGSVFGKRYPAHHIAWLITHGSLPAGEIDHINGNPSDNRLVNLRDVSHEANLKNQRFRSTNTSGVMGVSWNKREKKWRAYIHDGGKEKHIGYFTSRESAVQARAQAESLYGYHQNHGRAA